MHTGTALSPDGERPIQICVTRRRVQIASLDGGELWEARTRSIEIQWFGDDTLAMTVGGRRWLIRLDDPDRFRWEFPAGLRTPADATGTCLSPLRRPATPEPTGPPAR